MKKILFFIRFLSNRERIGEEIKIKSFNAFEMGSEDSIIVAAGGKGRSDGYFKLLVRKA